MVEANLCSEPELIKLQYVVTKSEYMHQDTHSAQKCSVCHQSGGVYNADAWQTNVYIHKCVYCQCESEILRFGLYSVC